MIKVIFFDFYGVINLGGELNREIAEFLNTNNDKYLFGILSAANIDLHDWLITHGINDYFVVVQTTAKAGKSKHDPKFYTDTLKALSVRPQNAVFIDDNPSYVELAQSLGLRALLYNPHQNFNDQIKPLL
jgi:putative hydrolase of the HAD superfamily